MSKRIIIKNISLPFYVDEIEAVAAAKKKVARSGLSPRDFSFDIYKRSVDARKKDDILFVYSVVAETRANIAIDETRISKYGISSVPSSDEEAALEIKKGKKKLAARPVVVGLGPAGMFCAMLLAENGYAPIVIERGSEVTERARKVETFYRDGILDENTNIQFGAGGAGTFSDGKLVTRINDERCNYVIRRFAEFGAPPDILKKAKPHIGTDILRNVVSGIAEHIISAGGEIRYDTSVRDIDGMCVVTDDERIDCGAIVLALGHSARDTYEMLLSRNFKIEPKPFSVGVRIEHLRRDIDSALYGKHAGDPRLGAAEYNLSDTTCERGVYTFCMCPGGEVVAAASEVGGVVVNGMSRYKRNGKNSNSAVAVSVMREDYGNTPMGAIEFQRRIERAAFAAGGGDYGAPVQTFGDFLADRASAEPRRVTPTYMDGRFKVARLSTVLPSFVTENLKRGILSFDRKISGFASDDALLTGAETRTSAPLRILRGEDLCAVGREGIYPCGEGAGYAGGITSAAVDGIKVALAIMEKYRPWEE